MSDIALLTILGSGACHPTQTDEADAKIDILANRTHACAPTESTQPVFDEIGELAQLVIDTLSSKRAR